MVRTGAGPPPLASAGTLDMPPSQVAWRIPLAKAQLPDTSYPPSRGAASPFPGPQARTARGSSPQISRATAGSRKAAVMAQPFP